MPLSKKSELSALLNRAGIDAPTAEAVMDIDAMLQQWRRRSMKRELGLRALVDLKIDMDLHQLDILVAIDGPASEFGEPQGEVMVASVAERLNIDPSRASRLVSDMVDKGYARRAVSQADARRTIIALTERGQTVVEAVRAYKYLIMGASLSTWDKSELATFVPLLKRFATWNEDIEPTVKLFQDEIRTLADGISEKVELA